MAEYGDAMQDVAAAERADEWLPATGAWLSDSKMQAGSIPIFKLNCTR